MKHGGAQLRAGAPSQRQLRVAEEIRHVLAGIFTRHEFRDPELAVAEVTVTEVRISPDLKRAAPYLRTQLAHNLRLRVAPDLSFQPDHTLDEATRINRLLHLPEVARDLDSD
jgi:ribosome-binding factor A